MNIKRSPRKKQRTNPERAEKPPIVIMMQDLEGFSPKILQDFILTARLVLMLFLLQAVCLLEIRLVG